MNMRTIEYALASAWRWLRDQAVWRRYHRGIIWLVVACVGLWALGSIGDLLGLSGYVLRRLGALLTVAATVWGGYRVSRDVLRIDPSAALETEDWTAYALLHLARAVFIGLLALAVMSLT